MAMNGRMTNQDGHAARPWTAAPPRRFVGESNGKQGMGSIEHPTSNAELRTRTGWRAENGAYLDEPEILGAIQGGAGAPHSKARRAFSLMELLVVIAIIGVLAAISFPAMKNVGKTNQIQAGVEQVLDDLTLARQKAINEQTVVRMIFVPADMTSINFDAGVTANATIVDNLRDAPYRGYALYAERSVGDQPGRATPSYITEWKRLPDGVIFQLDQFQSVADRISVTPPADRPFATNAYLFPTVQGMPNVVPFVAFDGQGRVVDQFGEKTYQDEVIELARGSVLAPRDSQGDLIADAYDVREVKEGPREERFARIVVDAFSGRAQAIPDKDLP